MLNKETQSNIYEFHHKKNRKEYFSIFEKERGNFILNIIKNKKNLNILDIGCRDGNLTKYFDNQNNNILGLDIDRNAMRLANKIGINTQYVDLNGNWEELENKKFELISAFEIIEHLYFPEVVIEKIHNRLNNGGIFIGSIPNAFSLPNRIRLFFGNKNGTPLSDPTHINQFGFDEFKKILEKKFKKVEITGIVDKKWMWLAKINSNLFSFMIIWKCEK